jgi:hypothetical protein
MSNLLSSLILTGTADGLKGMKSFNDKIENVPYERFPFCCSSRENNSTEREMNMSMRSSMKPIAYALG